MRTKLLVGLAAGVLALALPAPVNAVIVDFTGGTVYLSGGGTGTTNNSNLWTDVVDYYEEEGMIVDFTSNSGTIGDYYSINLAGITYNDDVIHYHWLWGGSIVFSKADGSAFDLNYFDVTSNTIVGGGQNDGSEMSFITTNSGYSMRLPSSDWGYDVDYYGDPGDGVARLWLDNNFDGITSFTVTSQNAYCFGLDQFYIDEPPPPQIPEPSTLVLLGTGLAGCAGFRLRRRK